jgi:hypothetical protein
VPIVAHRRLVVGVAGFAGGGDPVAFTLLPADVTPAAAVGDVAEFLHIDVQQRAGMVVFVAADRFTGAPVDMRQPVDPAADQHRMHGRGR